MILIARDIWRYSSGVFDPFAADLASASASILRGLIPSGQAGMQRPQPLQVAAQASEAGPSSPCPARKSMMPPATALAGCPAAAPNGITGQTSTHRPHFVQAATIDRASSSRNSCKGIAGELPTVNPGT